MNEYTFDALIRDLSDQREIEFTLDGQRYFATPDLPINRINEDDLYYGVLDVDSKLWIFQGTIQELIEFRFNNSSFLGNFDDFRFQYIL